MTRIFYVAHPIKTPDRDENVRRAKRWLRWLLTQYQDLAFVMPWLAYCDVLDESPENRDRGVRDDLVTLRHCDGIVLCGGRLSAGMKTELELVHSFGGEVINLLHLGVEPPEHPILLGCMGCDLCL